METLFVPGGRFLMGSTEEQVDAAIALCREHYQTCNRWYYEREWPQHPVSLAGFWLDRNEVTNAQYSQCVASGACAPPTTCKKGTPTYSDPSRADHPVVCVSWQDAQDYCAWAGARLPTEAEWEFAFRGELGHTFPWGDEFDGSRLNYCDADCPAGHADDRFDDGYERTSPAGSFAQGASWSGALGLAGNVSEWVSDFLGPYGPEDLVDPTGPPEGNEKMVKGGSWFGHPTYCRGTVRPSVDPDTRFDYLGFRCVTSPSE
jgi:formylglycine-generating enzyme required for sulfatase activity